MSVRGRSLCVTVEEGNEAEREQRCLLSYNRSKNATCGAGVINVHSCVPLTDSSDVNIRFNAT